MEETISLGHGSGGLLTHSLIRELFLRYFKHPTLESMGDAAIVPALEKGRLALTTDGYVVQPLFFPGGDIGKLAVCGTLNDLVVSGAIPLYLTASFIIEEGLPWATLERVVASMAAIVQETGVPIVAGDTKVVQHGAADQLFITTAGLGIVPSHIQLGPQQLKPGDSILVTGPVGDHGTVVMLAREALAFETDLKSDCAPLVSLLSTLLNAMPQQVRWIRDATRGGLATVLCEWAESAGLGIELEEEAVPVRPEVRAVSEFLGLDPLYIANEGRAVIAIAAEAVDEALALLRAHPLGEGAACIGSVTDAHPGRVVLRTPYGARRVIQMLSGAQLPRIC